VADKLRVLLVEDSEPDSALILKHLEKGGFQTASRRVHTASGMQLALDEESWDVVISDFVMPGFSGMEALRVLRENDIDIPCIMISGQVGEERAVEAMRAGAVDFVLKDKLSRLVPAIRRELRDAETRRKHRETEKKLAESEAMYRKLVENAGEGIAVVQDGRFRYVNQAMLHVLNRSYDDLINAPVAPAIHPDDRRRVLEYIERRLEGDTAPHRYELRMLDGDGETRWINNIGVLIEWDGRPAALGFLSDITERKEHQAELEQLNVMLESQQHSLQQKNVALREVLEQIEDNKKVWEKRVANNIENAVMPSLQHLKQSVTPAQARTIEMIQDELRDIASPFLDTMVSKFKSLSPRELEVARMIRNGLTTKEIAEALSLSAPTVHKYRELIRRKLGLTGQNTNLRTYMQSLIEEEAKETGTD
jgi:PAS domain S-box-containing protein